ARWPPLARHGYSAAVDSRERDKLYDQRDFLTFERRFGRERVGAVMRNPLTLTGLVLAGANGPAREGKPLGVLTAEAIAGQRLDRLGPAVLSACEPGPGPHQRRDGGCRPAGAAHVVGLRHRRRLPPDGRRAGTGRSPGRVVPQPVGRGGAATRRGVASGAADAAAAPGVGGRAGEGPRPRFRQGAAACRR